MKPTTTVSDSSNISFIQSLEGNMWYTSLTSNSSNDDALVALMGVNTLTGEAFYHRLGSSGGDEDAAITAIQSELGIESEKWIPIQPIPYNLLGKYPSYIVPVISRSSHMFVGIGIVNMKHTSKKAFQKGNNMEAAISKYLTALSSSDEFKIDASDINLLTGLIDTVSFTAVDGVPMFFITLSDSDEVLKCNGNEVKSCFKVKTNYPFKFETLNNGDGYHYVKTSEKLNGRVIDI